METVETIVIGAGVVGLAVARALARAGQEVVVLEAAATIGTETSSRNSEVIHAGIYYPQNSLKARLCLAGREALYAYCSERGIPHARLGKLIVASEESQLSTMETLLARGQANGVADLRRISAEEIAELEPAVNAVGGLLSPSSGVIDSHALMLSFQGDAEAEGAMVAFNSPVEGGQVEEGGVVIEAGGMTVLARSVINCAGLGAQTVASRIEGLDPGTIPPLYYAKGNYFALTGRAPFKRLIYPLPVDGGLGVHVTLDIAGRARFGPDVEWLAKPDYRDPDCARIDYAVDPTRAEPFYEAIRRYWPGLKDGALVPDYAGLRPKLAPAGGPFADFMIQGPAAHGIRGLINLYGIESPGLTASLAIGEEVRAMMEAA